MSRRTVIVGDVHGCADELDSLLDRLAFTATDRLFFVGDLVVRGPKPREVLAVARRLGARSVRGNHEHRLLSGKNTHSPTLDRMNEDTARALQEDDWSYLRNMPLWIDLPEHDVRIVHAGVMPDLAIDAQQERHLLQLRAIDEDGSAIMQRGRGQPWAARYTGPPHVTFGHHALRGPQLYACATGIDTACVYGGALTALVLPAGEPVPPMKERSALLVAEPARRAYANV